MHRKKQAVTVGLACLLIALAGLDLRQHWIPALREYPAALTALAICFSVSLGIAAAAYLLRQKRRDTLQQIGKALAYASSLLLLGALCVMTYLTEHFVASEHLASIR